MVEGQQTLSASLHLFHIHQISEHGLLFEWEIVVAAGSKFQIMQKCFRGVKYTATIFTGCSFAPYILYRRNWLHCSFEVCFYDDEVCFFFDIGDIHDCLNEPTQ